MLFLALSVLLPGAGRSQEGAEAPQSPVEHFKQFISSPPAIKNLVFQQKVPMDGGARPLDGSFALSTRYDYFQAKWQTNGLLFRRLAKPEDATNFNFAGLLVAVSDHQHTLAESNRRVTTWDDRDPTVPKAPISVFYTSQFVQEPLRRVMNLGMMYAGIGTVRWDGNRFRTVAEYDGEQIAITGELLPASSNAPPTGMKVHYAFPKQSYDYVLRYEYTGSRDPLFIPSLIRSFWLPRDRKNVEIEVDEWRVLDFRTSDTALADAAFDVTPFAQFNHWPPSQIYTNGGFYDQLPNGDKRLSFLLSSIGKPATAGRRIAPATFYLGWGGLNTAIFALMWGARYKTIPNKEEERSRIL